MQSVPQLYFYDTVGEPHIYDLRIGAELDDIIKFVQDQTGITINIESKMNTQLLLQSIIAAVLIGAFGLRFRASLWTVVSSPVVRGAATVLFCTLMTSGIMWNRIRKPTPFGYGPQGAIEYINPSLQQQYGVESHIVFAICTNLVE